MFSLVKEVNIRGGGGEEVFEVMDEFDRVLGLKLAERARPAAVEIPSDIDKLVAEREGARKSRDWATADRIRDELAAAGYVIEDTPHGPRVKVKPQ